MSQQRSRHFRRGPRHPLPLPSPLPKGCLLVSTLGGHIVSPEAWARGLQLQAKLGHQGNETAANSSFLAQPGSRFRTRGPEVEKKRGEEEAGRRQAPALPSSPSSWSPSEAAPGLLPGRVQEPSISQPQLPAQGEHGKAGIPRWLGLRTFTAKAASLIPGGPEPTQRAQGLRLYTTHAGKTHSLLPRGHANQRQV